MDARTAVRLEALKTQGPWEITFWKYDDNNKSE